MWASLINRCRYFFKASWHFLFIPDIFTQLSDIGKNSLVFQKFDACLKDLLQLPTSVYEEPSFGYRDNLAKSCFDWVSSSSSSSASSTTFCQYVWFILEFTYTSRRVPQRHSLGHRTSMLYLAEHFSSFHDRAECDASCYVHYLSTNKLQRLPLQMPEMPQVPALSRLFLARPSQWLTSADASNERVYQLRKSILTNKINSSLTSNLLIHLL